ncbi:hypothetical protein SMICM304S_02298 [Streptomyces microflavus]
MVLDERTVEMRTETADVLASWARLVVGARDEGAAGLDVESLVAFLRDEVEWIAGHPAAVSFDEEVRRLLQRLGALFGPAPVRGMPLGACVEPECTGTLLAVVRGGAGSAAAPGQVSCDAGQRWRRGVADGGRSAGEVVGVTIRRRRTVSTGWPRWPWASARPPSGLPDTEFRGGAAMPTTRTPVRQREVVEKVFNEGRTRRPHGRRPLRTRTSATRQPRRLSGQVQATLDQQSAFGQAVPPRRGHHHHPAVRARVPTTVKNVLAEGGCEITTRGRARSKVTAPVVFTDDEFDEECPR